MRDVVQRILIGYGSESGTARALARRLGGHAPLQSWLPTVLPLNDIDPGQLGSDVLLLIVSSSFGDGEPPGCAEKFMARLQDTPHLTGVPYAIFGLGDTAYPSFCGFTRALDASLQARGAVAVINRVDADATFEDFYARWLPVLKAVLAGDAQAGRELHLQVTAYGQTHAFCARVQERRRLNASDPGAWHIRLDIAGSGIAYRAGDNLYVLPRNDPTLLGHLAQWYGNSDAVAHLRDRELRQIGKPVLRELARLTGHDDLKALLKTSQRKALEAYLYGADILDVLQDFASPQSVPLPVLADLLSPILPRAYSIASHGSNRHIDLCVRHVQYTHRNRVRSGVATQWLIDSPAGIEVFVRANPGFRLPQQDDCPVILIGTGTGIAPLIGLLRDMQESGARRETCLIFGEKSCAQDFLYREDLMQLRAEGVLSHLITAFSRDSVAKYYVSHAIVDHAETLGRLLREGAHVYLCGNKQHLERSVEHAIAQVFVEPTSQTARSGWQSLAETGRLHRELY